LGYESAQAEKNVGKRRGKAIDELRRIKRPSDGSEASPKKVTFRGGGGGVKVKLLALN